MPWRTRCSANAGRLDGAWPHSDEVIPDGLAAIDDAADGVEHGRVGLVEDVGADLRVSVDPEHQLGQVVAADRHPR